MDQEQFKQMKESGELVTDAALQDAPKEAIIEEVIEEEVVADEIIEEEKAIVEQEEDDLPELDEKQKTAFDKRLEREKLKFEEKRIKELEEQYEQKFSKHKKVVDLMGGDPDQLEKLIEENKITQQANALAAQNNWTPEIKQWYIDDQKQKLEQQQTQQEVKVLRTQIEINKLKNDPDYAGIESMEKDILAKIDKSGGQLTVDEAFWAIGGPKKAAQIKLEATMREAEKRKTQPRTVLTDNPTTTTGEKPLPADVVRDMERMGITAAEARKLMSTDSPKNIDEYRKSKAK